MKKDWIEDFLAAIGWTLVIVGLAFVFTEIFFGDRYDCQRTVKDNGGWTLDCNPIDATPGGDSEKE